MTAPAPTREDIAMPSETTAPGFKRPGATQ